MKNIQPGRDSAPESFASLERQVLELLWSTDPVRASLLGLEEYDAHLPHTDPGSRSEFRRQCADLLARLERLPAPADGAAAARAERWALSSLLRVPMVLEEEFSPYTRNPVLYLEATLQGIYILFQRAEPLDEARGRAACSRLREGARLLGEARANLKPHAARVPALWAEASLRLVGGGESLIRRALDTLRRDLPALARDSESAGALLLGELEKYAAFVREQILPRARGNFAIGRDLFHFLLREEHRLPFRDVDLLEWGQHEVREARRELERLGRRIESGRGWRDILEEMKRDHPRLDELVPVYRAEVERARGFVQEHGLAELTEDVVSVEETPEFERTVAPFAAYLPAAPFARLRRGCLWITPPGRHLSGEEREECLRDHCRSRIPVTVVHEAYPGHHLQFSRMCRLRSSVRRHFATPVSVEGWALYCEEMMLSQGYLADPRTRLFQVRDHLWRACRVVLDVRLHTQGLGTDEAARMLVGEASLQPPIAAAEVSRYTHTPTQPLSYLIGKREIQALQREVERARGPRFRLGEFHDQFLDQGALPISFVREILLSPAPEPEPAPVAG